MDKNAVSEAARKKYLGDLGEQIAEDTLVKKGFKKIKNLNIDYNNSPFADIYAEKEDKRYIISVKTRNKYGANGKVNPAYNLAFGGGDEKAREMEKKYRASAHWMAVQIDKETYWVYFGSLQELGGSRDISMSKCRKGKIGECFVEDEKHSFDYELFHNKKKEAI